MRASGQQKYNRYAALLRQEGGRQALGASAVNDDEKGLDREVKEVMSEVFKRGGGFKIFFSF